MTVGGNFEIDEAVLEAVGQLGARVVHADSHGVSQRSTKTAKVTTLKDDGTTVYFFLNQVEGDSGKAQLEGKYVGMRELYKLAPEFVIWQYARGKLKAVDTYFLLTEFKDFAVNAMRDPAKLAPWRPVDDQSRAV